MYPHRHVRSGTLGGVSGVSRQRLGVPTVWPQFLGAKLSPCAGICVTRFEWEHHHARATVGDSMGRTRNLLRHQRAPSRWRATGLPIVKGVAIALAVVMTSGLSVSAVAVWQFSNELSNNALDISNGGDDDSRAIGSFVGGFNALLVGVDNAPDQSLAFGDRGSTLNDVTMLVHVAPDHKSAVIISFPRDLAVPQPKCTAPDTGAVSSSVSHQPINAAFGRGGLGCVVATIQELTGVRIPFAGLITFRGTVAMADAVGGVPICVKSPLVDRKAGLNLPAGTSTISGETALAYLRSRHGVGDGSDLSRISSQQAYLSSLFRVMKKRATLTNIPQLVDLANVVAANLKLSRSLASVPTLMGMATALNEIALNKLAFVQFPTSTDPDDANRVVPSERLATRLLAMIKADQSVSLDADSLGKGTVLESPSPTPRAKDPRSPAAPGAPASDSTPGQNSHDSSSIDGLRGQTADEQTCSVAGDS